MNHWTEHVLSRRLLQVADEMAYVFKPPWWKVWRRPWRTKIKIREAMFDALIGDVKPIQVYGVSLPANPPPPAEVQEFIVEQTRRFK